MGILKEEMQKYQTGKGKNRKKQKKIKNMLTPKKKFGILRWQFAKRSRNCE